MKPITAKELAALRFIRNRLAHGQDPPTVREIAELLKYHSPNAAAYTLNKLVARGYIRRRADGKIQLLQDAPEDSPEGRTVRVPLVGVAPCGVPFLAEQNVEVWIPVSLRLARPPHRYFLLSAVGDSMNNAGIQDGDLVLVRQQSFAENSDRVVALIDDEATIKVFRRTKDVVVLQPDSTNPEHNPILLDRDFAVQGKVITSFPHSKHDGKPSK